MGGIAVSILVIYFSTTINDTTAFTRITTGSSVFCGKLKLNLTKLYVLNQWSFVLGRTYIHIDHVNTYIYLKYIAIMLFKCLVIFEFWIPSNSFWFYAETDHLHSGSFERVWSQFMNVILFGWNSIHLSHNQKNWSHIFEWYVQCTIYIYCIYPEFGWMCSTFRK